jgi:sigma-B regulation protein RsbU (phosphoserine phosphatase)
MEFHELICSELWGGNGSVYTDVVMPGMKGVVFSRACGGGKGGDVYYSTACASGVIARVCLADVVGHGEQVSQVSSWLHGTLRSNMNRYNPARVFDAMNQRATLFGFEALTTAACVSYELTRGRLRYCYAGHPPVLLNRRGTDAWQPMPLESSGDKEYANVPFGVSDKAHYDTAEVRLNPGDRLFIYSDGVIEAPDAAQRLFGVERLQSILKELGQQPLETVAQRLVQILAAHCGTEEFQHDDVSFVTLEVDQRSAAPALWHMV